MVEKDTNVSQEAMVQRPGPVMAFIRLGRFPYAIEAMLRGAVGALCYAYEYAGSLISVSRS